MSRNFHQMYDYEWGDPDSGKEMKSKSVYLTKRSHTGETTTSLSTMASRPRGLGFLGRMYGAAPQATKLMDGSEDEGEDDSYVYPQGLRRIALLGCALVPYMVVSEQSDCLAHCSKC